MATQAFLDQYRQGGGALRHLLLLTVPRDDGTQNDTLYLADTEVATAADVVPGPGRFWTSGVLDFQPVSLPGSFCSTAVALATATVVLNADKAVTLPAGVGGAQDTTLRKMLQTHVLTNAPAMIYRHFEGLGGAGDAQALGPFAVLEVDLEGSRLTLQLRQRADWNIPVAQRYVTRQDYPRAADAAVGLGLPIRYGHNRCFPLRRPWPSRYGNPHLTVTQLRGGKGGPAPALLVDTGRGSGAAVNAKSRVVVAGHLCKEPIKATSVDGTDLFMEASDKLARWSATAGNTFNTATEAGALLADDWLNNVHVTLQPQEILAPVNSAHFARHLLAGDEVNYALLDQANTLGYGNARELQVRLPSLPDLGTPVASVSMVAVVGYRSSSPLTGLKMGLYNDALTLLSTVTTVPASTTPAEHFNVGDGFTSWASPWPTSPWAFGADRILRVFFDQAASPAGWCRIYYLGLLIAYKPRLSLVTAAREVGSKLKSVKREGPIIKPKFVPYYEPILAPETTELRGAFWATPKGHKDDGTGTYTGTADALIERLPDLLRHLLVTYGGQSDAKIERAAGALGSFTDARDLLVDGQGNALAYAYPISGSTDINTCVTDLCGSAMSLPLLSPYDDTWRIIVWRQQPAITYPWKFSRWDIDDPLGPAVKLMPMSDIVTGIRIPYSYNARTRTYDSEVALGHARSVAGHYYHGLRDQYMSVVAGVNDRLDFKPSGAAALVAQLTADEYTVAGWCQHLKAQMDAAAVAASSSARFIVGAGGTIVAGYNDRLSYDHGGSDFYVGILPGTYTTMKATCNAAMHGLNYAADRIGTHASGSRLLTITSTMKTPGILAGMIVTGAGSHGIPANTTVVSVTDTTLTISADTTLAYTGEYKFTDNRTVSFGNGVAVITMASTAGLVRGLRLTHAGFPVGTVILSVDSATQITASANSDRVGTGVTMQFSTASGADEEWLLDYAPATDSNEGKVTAARASGLFAHNILAGASSTAAERATSGWAALGFSQLLGDISAPTTPSVTTAHDDRFVAHVYIQSLHSVTDYLLQSGTNGQDSATAVRHCGDLLGAPGANDILGIDNTHGSVCFFCPKGTREAEFRKAVARYGARREVEFEGRAIYSTDVALELRNRVADLLSRPRTVIQFSTTKAPDIERGHVFEFWPDMDDFHYPGLGTDGKWTGKRFIVVEVAHYLGPTSRGTTIVAVDASALPAVADVPAFGLPFGGALQEVA